MSLFESDLAMLIPKFLKHILFDSPLPLLGISPKYRLVNEQEC